MVRNVREKQSFGQSCNSIHINAQPVENVVFLGVCTGLIYMRYVVDTDILRQPSFRADMSAFAVPGIKRNLFVIVHGLVRIDGTCSVTAGPVRLSLRLGNSGCIRTHSVCLARYARLVLRAAADIFCRYLADVYTWQQYQHIAVYDLPIYITWSIQSQM